MGLSAKHREFIDNYFLSHLNGTEAYCLTYGVSRKVGSAASARLLGKVSVQNEIKRRTEEKTATADEILIGLTEQGRASLRDFFKISETWLYNPLPSHEIIDEREEEVTDEEGQVIGKRTKYLVRRVCIDTDKLVDPNYAHLLREFGDSPKNGISIKLHDKQTAWRDIAKLKGLIVDRNVHQNPDGTPLEPAKIVNFYIPDNGRPRS